MGTVRRVSLAVLGVLVVASLVFGLRSWVGLAPASEVDATDRSGSTPTPTPSPSASAPGKPASEPTTSAPKPRALPRMSTASAAALVKSRLDRKGRSTSVVCPPSVPAVVGTRFTCAVSFAGSPGRVVADATVTVRGPGRVSFVSVPR